MKPLAPTVAAVVREQARVSWSKARALCEQGRVRVNGERCVDPTRRVPEGASVVVDANAPKIESGPLVRSAIVHVDRDVVVVDKPAGMLTVADEAGNKETLADYTRTLLRRVRDAGADGPLGVVHRLDRDTSGVMVFTRTADAKRKLAAQFRAHTVERVYHAIAHGDVAAARVESDLVLDRGDGLRGSIGAYRRGGAVTSEARHAITYLKPVERLSDATLVECRLETGRQHQIRIHLSELGHPLVGERVYIRGYGGPKIEAPRVMLHALRLAFVHPRTGETVMFERDPPADFAAMLESLR